MTGWIGCACSDCRQDDETLERKHEVLRVENRRMRWLLEHVLTPGEEEFTLWDTYKNADEEYWERQGL